VFNEGMTGFSMRESPAVAEAYDFSPFGTIIDVGGGHGHLLCTILRSPNASGMKAATLRRARRRDRQRRRR
jgi:hypothetical protein